MTAVDLGTVSNRESFQLLNFIVCDEARPEASRKILVIGMYTGTIIVSSEDLPLPRLAFVFSINRLTDELATSATFRLERSDGELVLPQATFALEVSREFTASNIIINIGGIALRADGYFVRLRVNDRAEFVGRFTVSVNPNLLTPVDQAAVTQATQ